MTFSETIFLFFLALIIFGPKKLPEIARQVGKALNEFRRASNEFKAQIEQEISNLEAENRKQTILPPSSTPEGATSRTQLAEANAVNAVPESNEAPASLAVNENETANSSSEPPPRATEADVPAAPANPAADSNHDVTSPASQESHV